LDSENKHHRSILQRIAENAMRERGLLPEFSAEVRDELSRMQKTPPPGNGPVRDLRHILWASIDNDDSRDLDQLTAAEPMPGGGVKILVAVADVDSLVKDGSAIDRHARHNTTSVYTAARIFPMLPEQLSTGLTSLNPDVDRAAIVVEMEFDAQGALQRSEINRARVTNHAKLAYNSVAAWLDGNGPAPEALAAAAGLEENLRLQDRVAQQMDQSRHAQGALSLETIEAKPVFEGDELRSLTTEEKNRAKGIIENFMIAANGVTARYLAAKKFPSIRRVVRVPKRWDRIVALAAERRIALPDEPDSRALEDFLLKERAADPVQFPDLSLAVIKLLGSGEYIAEAPDGDAPGHFGLAVKDYTHSTAPNRRYSDILTQRQLKAALQGDAPPYRLEQLAELAAGFEGVDVGDRIRVQLASVDVQRGFIDFRKVNH
jgi:VacB/RNase II family 3'-5' exoribonuclease